MTLGTFRNGYIAARNFSTSVSGMVALIFEFNGSLTWATFRRQNGGFFLPHTNWFWTFTFIHLKV